MAAASGACAAMAICGDSTAGVNYGAGGRDGLGGRAPTCAARGHAVVPAGDGRPGLSGRAPRLLSRDRAINHRQTDYARSTGQATTPSLINRRDGQGMRVAGKLAAGPNKDAFIPPKTERLF